MPVTLTSLSRTCNLRDFPGVVTVAGWQQALADYAYAAWIAEHHLRTRDGALVHNWSDCPFVAPGPTATYRYPGQRDDRVEGAVPAVFGLCVLNHTEAPVRFLTQARERLTPKGLLFLSCVFWNAQGPDVAKGHEHRTRIYDAASWRKLIREAKGVGYETYGGVDWAYHGDFLEDHTLAALVLTRR